MDFRHLIVTCLFSKLRLPFDNQKVKENYAIFLKKLGDYHQKYMDVIKRKPAKLTEFLNEQANHIHKEHENKGYR